jgi:hypothetical protein
MFYPHILGEASNKGVANSLISPSISQITFACPVQGRGERVPLTLFFLINEELIVAADFHGCACEIDIFISSGMPPNAGAERSVNSSSLEVLASSGSVYVTSAYVYSIGHVDGCENRKHNLLRHLVFRSHNRWQLGIAKYGEKP